MARKAKKVEVKDLVCSGCGGCCKIPIVALTHTDLERLVKATGKTAGRLVKMYDATEVEYDKADDDWVKLKSGRRMMGLRKKEGACIFLGKDNRCTVYEHRPVTCRVYPMMMVFGGEGDNEGGYELGDFNGAGVKSCDAHTVKAEDPDRVRRLFRINQKEREEFWRLLRMWEKRKKPGKKKEFLRFLGFDV